MARQNVLSARNSHVRDAEDVDAGGASEWVGEESKLESHPY